MLRWLKVLVCLFFCGVFAVPEYKYWLYSDDFATKSQTALVEPIYRFVEHTNTASRDKMPFLNKSYYADINFNTATGQQISVNMEIPKRVVKNFKEGRKVYVRYLTERPDIFRFKDEPHDAMGNWLFIVILLGMAGYWFVRKE